MKPSHARPVSRNVLHSLVGWFLCAGGVAAVAAEPLPQAHAHNDYLHSRPLMDAIDHGFTSVEADVFLVNGDLLVAHTRAELDASKTFRKLYLEPLRHRVQAGDGRVYPGSDQPFRLLIDIKSDAESTYAELDRQLAKEADLFTVVRDGKLQRKALEAVVSGNRPLEMMRSQSIRYAGVDGRLGDLDSKSPIHLMPLISDRWGSHFRWDGEGEIEPKELAKLERIVERAHTSGRRIRFWATPETPHAWALLRDAGVDHINTDDLQGLERFLRGESADKDEQGERPAR